VAELGRRRREEGVPLWEEKVFCNALKKIIQGRRKARQPEAAGNKFSGSLGGELIYAKKKFQEVSKGCSGPKGQSVGPKRGEKEKEHMKEGRVSVFRIKKRSNGEIRVKDQRGDNKNPEGKTHPEKKGGEGEEAVVPVLPNVPRDQQG